MNNYKNYPNINNYRNYPYRNNNQDRFLLAPFLVGGLAGTALGYGIANNQIGRYYPPIYLPAPVPMPYYYNNFYY